ncbi:hypothetical protein IAS59_001562 [Cryptococcus gattii]
MPDGRRNRTGAEDINTAANRAPRHFAVSVPFPANSKSPVLPSAPLSLLHLFHLSTILILAQIQLLRQPRLN